MITYAERALRDRYKDAALSLRTLNSWHETSLSPSSIAWNGDKLCASDLVYTSHPISFLGVKFIFKCLYRYSDKICGFSREPIAVIVKEFECALEDKS
tara:strand:+ start:47 stop:340 length:294 start_codon:yes stop_codon:yes gene_type:complete